MTPDAQAALDAINNCRTLIMELYGGNLDHPALDQLEIAMGDVMRIDRLQWDRTRAVSQPVQDYTR